MVHPVIYIEGSDISFIEKESLQERIHNVYNPLILKREKNNTKSLPEMIQSKPFKSKVENLIKNNSSSLKTAIVHIHGFGDKDGHNNSPNDPENTLEIFKELTKLGINNIILYSCFAGAAIKGLSPSLNKATYIYWDLKHILHIPQSMTK